MGIHHVQFVDRGDPSRDGSPWYEVREVQYLYKDAYLNFDGVSYFTTVRCTATKTNRTCFSEASGTAPIFQNHTRHGALLVRQDPTRRMTTIFEGIRAYIT